MTHGGRLLDDQPADHPEARPVFVPAPVPRRQPDGDVIAAGRSRNRPGSSRDTRPQNGTAQVRGTNGTAGRRSDDHDPDPAPRPS